MAKEPTARMKKYAIAKLQGKTKTEAARIAGYASKQVVTTVEKLPSYQALEAKLSYKDYLLKHISLDEIAQEQLKVAKQDEDRGAKNTAIKQMLERIEPEKTIETSEERIMVVVK